MPGVCRTRSLAYEGRKYASRHYRYAETVRHSLRNGFTAYSALLCLQNLPECANGRLDENRPSLDLIPSVLKGPRA
jgi:hypothetical protein